MTKKELIAELAERCDISKRKAETVLSDLASIAYREAVNPSGFSIPGLCKLKVVTRKERRARNPKTGQALLIGEHKALRVSALKKAKDAIAPTPKDLVKKVKDQPKPEVEILATEDGVTETAEEELIGLECPLCNQAIEAVPQDEDVTVECPACKGLFTMPGRATLAAQAEKTASKFIAFRCSSCNQDIEAPVEMVGSETACPSCDTTLIVPEESDISTPSNEDGGGEADSSSLLGTTMRIELPGM